MGADADVGIVVVVVGGQGREVRDGSRPCEPQTKADPLAEQPWVVTNHTGLTFYWSALTIY